VTPLTELEEARIRAHISDVCIAAATYVNLDEHARAVADTVIACLSAPAPHELYLARRTKEEPPAPPTKDARTAPYPKGVYVP
jgi:hypothetical protein